MSFKLFPTPFFEKKLKQLSKKYPHIGLDIGSLVDSLESGTLCGDRISGLSAVVYKVRIPSSDQKKGKSGGFRVLYYVKTSLEHVYFLTIYAKAYQEDIRTKEIQSILDLYSDIWG